MYSIISIENKQINIKKYIDKGQMSLYNSNTGKGQKCLIEKKSGFYIHQADGGNNSLNGYIHFASIGLLHTATAADISMPITFEVIGSDYKSPITIIVTFEPYVAYSSMTINAKLKRFITIIIQIM